MKLEVNKKWIEVEPEHQEYTLQQLISTLPDLPGTHFGCGKGLCGACTVHLNDVAVRSCQLKVKDVLGQKITTIEGLSGEKAGELHALQHAFIDHQVPQCGYCIPGQIMSASSLLQAIPKPSTEEIRHGMSGNLCRCGTYPRIEKAIQQVSKNSVHKEL